MDARQGTLHAATTKDTSKEESTDGEISLLVVKCLQSFGQILPLSDQPIFSTLRDEETRFKVWSGNIGAHKKGRSSLDYRLRDASHLQKQVLNLLADLAALIEDATAIVDGDKVPWDQLEEDSLTGDDGDEDGDEGIPETELGQIATDVVEVVDCLLRLSVTIRNPAPHDRFVASAATETLHYEPYDTQHVRSKFGDTVNEALAKRLGEAISRRRQYFKYRESHHTKLSSSLDSDAKDAASTVASSIPHHMKDSATNNTQPMVGVVDEDARSDAGASETSFASSAASDAKLRVPPLPQQAQKGPFECPFCFMMIAATNTISWKRHVYGDLRPYTCLSEDCQTPEHEFSRRQEWMEHEIQNHWRKFCCPCGCEETFASASACKAHVRSNHLAEVSTGQLDALVDLSARPLKVEDGMACRLCGETLFSLKQYRRHVGRHQEQLSLFALPSLGQGTEDEDESEATEDSGHENEVFEEDSGGGADSGTKRGQASADSEVMWDIVVEQTYYASDDEQPEPEQIHPDHPLLQASSYWSVSESTDFPLLLRSFGTDWSSIAAHMQTKTPVMVRNYYLRNMEGGKPGWEAIAAEADAGRKRGKLRPAPPPPAGPREHNYKPFPAWHHSRATTEPEERADLGAYPYGLNDGDPGAANRPASRLSMDVVPEPNPKPQTPGRQPRLEPGTDHQEAKYAPDAPNRGMLKSPRLQFPEDPNLIRDSVATRESTVAPRVMHPSVMVYSDTFNDEDGNYHPYTLPPKPSRESTVAPRVMHPSVMVYSDTFDDEDDPHHPYPLRPRSRRPRSR